MWLLKCSFDPGVVVRSYLPERVTDGRTGSVNVAAGVGDVVLNCVQLTCKKINK